MRRRAAAWAILDAGIFPCVPAVAWLAPRQQAREQRWLRLKSLVRSVRYEHSLACSGGAFVASVLYYLSFLEARRRAIYTHELKCLRLAVRLGLSVSLQKWENGLTGRACLEQMKELLTARGAWPVRRSILSIYLLNRLLFIYLPI